MGAFSGFLGQNDGYTKAQRTGLQRSAEIKKRRKEEERTFEREKMKFAAEEIEKEKADLWAGKALEGLKEADMGKGGGMKPQPESRYKMQELRGRQATKAAEAKGVRAAEAASMKYARGLTTGELAHGRAMELAKAKGEDALSALFATPGERARAGLTGGEESKGTTLTNFLDMEDSEKTPFMTRLKKEDPDAYLALAEQYELWAKPKKELP